tara:strand:- start:948 stop:1247 length:300 start_codon:yes stop_codon:yes gene_type:complete
MKETMKSLAYLDTLTALSYGLLYETPEPITEELTPEQFENTADIEKDSPDDNDRVREFSELDNKIMKESGDEKTKQLSFINDNTILPSPQPAQGGSKSK